MAQVWLQRLGAGTAAASPADDAAGWAAASAAAFLRRPRALLVNPGDQQSRSPAACSWPSRGASVLQRIWLARPSHAAASDAVRSTRTTRRSPKRRRVSGFFLPNIKYNDTVKIVDDQGIESLKIVEIEGMS